MFVVKKATFQMVNAFSEMVASLLIINYQLVHWTADKYILTTQNYTFLLDLLYWKYISMTKL